MHYNEKEVDLTHIYPTVLLSYSMLYCVCIIPSLLLPFSLSGAVLVLWIFLLAIPLQLKLSGAQRPPRGFIGELHSTKYCSTPSSSSFLPD